MDVIICRPESLAASHLCKEHAKIAKNLARKKREATEAAVASFEQEQYEVDNARTAVMERTRQLKEFMGEAPEAAGLTEELKKKFDTEYNMLIARRDEAIRRYEVLTVVIENAKKASPTVTVTTDDQAWGMLKDGIQSEYVRQTAVNELDRLRVN